MRVAFDEGATSLGRSAYREEFQGTRMYLRPCKGSAYGHIAAEPGHLDLLIQF